jgi:hypothetical protein
MLVAALINIVGTVATYPSGTTRTLVVVHVIHAFCTIAARWGARWDNPIMILIALVDIDATVLPSISSDARTDVSWCVGGLRALAFVVAWL